MNKSFQKELGVLQDSYLMLIESQDNFLQQYRKICVFYYLLRKF